MTLLLTVNGANYGGWQSITVKRGIESICGGYSLGVSDKWAQQASAWPIKPGDECSISLGGATVITGYVDSRDIDFSANSHTLTIAGRDKAADLVDSSAVLGRWQFKGQNALQICQAIAKPYGVPVALGAGVALPKPQADFSINPGESAFEAIDRICRLSGLLPISDGLGGIVLTIGTTTVMTADALAEGVNILAASANINMAERYNKYIVGGQHKGTDELNGQGAAGVQAIAYDTLVRPSRVLYVRPEGIVTPAAAQRRAQWEASVRAARAVDVSVTVQGWQQSSGALWPVNALVPLNSGLLGINATMLITEAEYSLNDSGTTTKLTLKRPQAYQPEPTENVGTTKKKKAKKASTVGVGSNPFED